MLYFKTIKIINIIIMNVQSNPMSANIRVLIKIYYISPILYLKDEAALKIHFVVFLPFLFPKLALTIP